MRKRLLIMMTALAMTTATVPGTAMVTYAEGMDIAENAEEMQTEEAKKKAEEEAKKKAEEEAKKKAEEAERQAEEARRAAEEEAERQAEEARRAAEEEAERQAEEARRAAEEEAERQAEEARRAAEEEAERQAEEARRAAEEEAERQAEEARRAAEEEAERQAEEARRAAEEEAEKQDTNYNINYVWEQDTEKSSGYICTAVAANAEEIVLTESVEATLEEIPASCEESGQDIYTAVFENQIFETQVKKEEIPALGHIFEEPTYSWNDADNTCTATRVCERDGYTETETVAASSEVILEPTSTEAGIRRYIAEFTNPAFSSQLKKEEIPATGRKFAEPTYKWNDADNTCTATRVCEEDGYTETETVAASSEVVLEPTCTEAGIRRYIAEFTNPAFSSQLKKEEIPATGHRFAEPTYKWNDADNTCTATRVCEKDGYTETETATASSEVILEPTSTETGIRRYIVTFKNPAFSAQLKKVEIPATGKKTAENKKENKTVVKKTTAQTQNTAQATKKSAPVKTGDTTQPIIPIAAGTGALAAIAAIILKFRKNRG